MTERRQAARRRRFRRKAGGFAVLITMLVFVLLGLLQEPEAPAERPRGCRFSIVPFYMEYGTETGDDIDTSGFIDPGTKNNVDLVLFAREAWSHQWGYVWGMFGDVLTETWLTRKLEQYPEEVGEQEALIREKWLGRRAADCVGLIKAYGWYDPETGAILYDTGPIPDCSTETMFEAALVSGPVDTIPEIPGLIVYREGHVGIYIGDGFVIEAKGTDHGVVKTKLSQSEFTHWFQCPYIEYYTEG